ncbi:BTAD domain-containing putative transcriptional regulator [Kitasatospora sp. NPDC101183]|uniref:AfsR/SARP family transcriptional regulator n=1 Tax=Kitasatospora sp. NPDC101183 TaxID=3364100 RepID=UPI00381D909A
MTDNSLTAGRLRFRVLGPVGVLVGEEEVEFQSPRQQAVLAALLLHAPNVVSVDYLIEAIWDDAPSTARKQVQACVSMLRRAFARLGHNALIETRAAGYSLKIADRSLDFETFKALRDSAHSAQKRKRHDDAAAAYLEAFQVWQGPALYGLTSRYMQARATWLNEQRWCAYEEYLELQLATGRHREIIGELEMALVDHPTREKLRGYLMLALYQSGRRADALETYQTSRRILVDMLGIEPAPDLQRLHAAILAAEPGVAVTSALFPNVLGMFSAPIEAERGTGHPQRHG